MNAVTLNQTPPTGLTPDATRAALNNNLAWAYASGDPRMAMKEYDRPGMSRGAAQRNQAGIDSARTMSEGIADAYRQDMQSRAYNANVGLQGQRGQEQFAQALAALQEQNNYANQMAALQRQQASMGLLGGLMKGLFDE